LSGRPGSCMRRPERWPPDPPGSSPFRLLAPTLNRSWPVPPESTRSALCRISARQANEPPLRVHVTGPPSAVAVIEPPSLTFPSLANAPLAPTPSSTNDAPVGTVSDPLFVTVKGYAPPCPDVEGDGIVRLPLLTVMLPEDSFARVPEKNVCQALSSTRVSIRPALASRAARPSDAGRADAAVVAWPGSPRAHRAGA